MTAMWTWLQAAAGAPSATVPVVVVGSSTVAGSNATLLSTRNTSLLAAILKGKHNTAGVPGGIGIGAADAGTSNGWTRSGGSTVTNRGLGFSAYQLDADDYIERSFGGTAVTVLYEQGADAGQFSVSIDGGAATTVTPDTDATDVNSGSWTSSTLSAGAHTVRITGVGTCVIEAVYAHNGDTTAGVQLWPCGLSGATTSVLADTPGLVTRLGYLDPALVVLILTANDYSTGVDPATTKSRIQAWLDDIFEVASPSVLLVQPQRRLDVTDPDFPYEDYGTALAEIAAADPDRVAYVDVSGLFPESQDDDDWDVFDTDDIHLTDRGHNTLADALADALGIGLAYDSSLSRVRVAAAVGPDPTSATVERSTDQIRWTDVRGTATVAGGVAQLDDYEFAANVTNYYRVTAGTKIADAFGRTETDDWGDADTGETWTNIGGVAGDFDVAAGVGTQSHSAVGASRRSVVGGSRFNSDQYATVSTPALASGAQQEPSIMGRHTDLNNLLKAAEVRFETDQKIRLAITTRVSGVEVVAGGPTVITGLTHAANTKFRLRGQIIGCLLRGKVWLASGTEPPVWQLSAISAVLMSTSGQQGVRSVLSSGNTNTLPLVFSWDDYEAPAVQLTGSITPALEKVWIKSVARPFLNREVVVADFSDVARRARRGVFDVVGRANPVAVSDVRSSREWTLTLMAATADEARGVELALASGDPLFIHVPGTGKLSAIPGGYVSVGDTSVSRRAPNSAKRFIDLMCTEVAAPAAEIVGATYTYANAKADYATYADLAADNDTYADLAQNVGDAEDVIVE